MKQIIKQIQPTKTYVKVMLTSQGKTIGPLRAQIDTGNTIRSDLVIREDVQRQIGVPYVYQGTKHIGTAAPGANLINMGRVRTMHMKMDKMKKTFPVQATVVKNMSDPVNIGSHFLQRLSTVMDRVSIHYVNGETIIEIGDEKQELIQCMTYLHDLPCKDSSTKRKESTSRKDDDSRVKRPVQTSTRSPAENSSENTVRVKKDTVLRKNELTFVDVQTPGRSLDRPTILVEPRKSPDSETQVVTGVYHFPKFQKIAMINIGKESRMLKRGETIATFTELQEVEPRQQTKPREQISQLTAAEMDNLYTELKIDENEILKENPEIKQQLKDLIQEYADIFSSPTEEFGKTSLLEFDIKLKKNATPVAQRCRPLNPAQRKDLQKTMEAWLKGGIIEKAPPHSEWASALVPALKKDGTIRWAVDYRQLNNATVYDRYPLPMIEQNLELLQGSRYYSCLDAAAAYHTIPVAASAKPYLAFVTPFGLYTFARMPFGARNSGSCYSRFVDMVISRMTAEGVLAYIDDIITHTRNLEDHIGVLRKVFQAHREAGLKLRAKKTQLIQQKVDYLGYTVSPAGISMIEKYVEKIISWPVPKTNKALSSFLGFVGFYRSFIKDFSYLTNEMNTMKKGTTLKWTTTMDEKFNELKKRFKEQPIRAYPDYGNEAEPFQLSVDFSCQNLGAVLTQVQGGKERLIGVAGRKTTTYEQNYHSTKGELAAVLYGLRKFEHILRFKKFILHTDNSSITWLQTAKQPRGITFRWLTELQSFQFDIKHRPGKHNVCADAVSRSEHLEPPTKDEEEEEAEYVHRIQQFIETIEPLGETLQIGAMTDMDDEPDPVGMAVRDEDHLQPVEQVQQDPGLVDLKEKQYEDPTLRQVIDWVKSERKPTKEELRGKPELLKAYAQQLDLLKLHDDTLYHVKTFGQIQEKPVWRIVVPESKYLAMFKAVHEDSISGHFGEHATDLKAKTKFYFPGIVTFIKRQVALCQQCIAKQQKPKQRDTTHQPVTKKGYPGELLFIDLVGPLNVTKNNHRYILSIEDGYTRFVQAIPLINKEAKTVARALCNQYITTFGCPTQIHSDQGTEFTNRIMQELEQRFEIKRSFTPAYNPWSNAVERWHRTLSAMMRTLMEREDLEWDRVLPTCVFAYNTKVHSSTGLTPFFMNFGREARLPIDLILPSPDDERREHHDFVKETLRNFTLMYDYTRRQQDATFRRNAKLYSGRPNFKEGDLVWYLSPVNPKEKTTKLTNQWIGPYRVMHKESEVVFIIEPVMRVGRRIRCHVTRLRPCVPKAMLRPQDPTNGEAEEETRDELAEEITRPSDSRPVINVPIQVQVSNDGEPMRDLTTRGRGRPRKNRERSQSTQRKEPENTSDIMPPPAPRPPPQTDSDNSMAGGAAEKRRVDKRSTQTDDDRRTRLRTKSPRWKRRFSPDLTSDTDESQVNRPDKIQRPNTNTPTKEPLPTTTEDFDSSDDDHVNMMLPIKIKSGSTKPERATKLSACYDIQSKDQITLPANSITKVDINLRVKIPDEHFMLLWSRSGLATRGVTTLAGVIDSDYIGPIYAVLQNHNNEPFKINRGQRISQAFCLARTHIDWQYVDELPRPEEDHLGFGSSDSRVNQLHYHL